MNITILGRHLTSAFGIANVKAYLGLQRSGSFNPVYIGIWLAFSECWPESPGLLFLLYINDLTTLSVMLLPILMMLLSALNVISHLLLATWNCWISYKNCWSFTWCLSLPLAHCWNVASFSVFYRYYFGKCFSELAQLGSGILCLKNAFLWPMILVALSIELADTF